MTSYRSEHSLIPKESLSGEVVLDRSPDKSLQGSETHKVLGRGRPSLLLQSLQRARVLKRTRSAPELSR